jgi:hypothetical protein
VNIPLDGSGSADFRTTLLPTGDWDDPGTTREGVMAGNEMIKKYVGDAL